MSWQKYQVDNGRSIQKHQKEVFCRFIFQTISQNYELLWRDLTAFLEAAE